MPVTIATWNINSVRLRLRLVLRFLRLVQPDILCLQEIKCLEGDFPRLEVQALGYTVEAIGQRAYNGVAIVSKEKPRDVIRGLPGNDGSDDHARYIEATFGPDERPVRVASIYLPNGNPIGTDKFAYKLAWMDRLYDRARELLRCEMPFVLAGDYNVIPTDDDVYDPVAFRLDALTQPESRARFRALLYLGLTDAFRVFQREPHRYTYWDYQAGRWSRDEGLRIDHLLLSPHAADRIAACAIDKAPRGKERASDHTPIWCELAN